MLDIIRGFPMPAKRESLSLEKVLESKISDEWFIILKNFITVYKYKKGEVIITQGEPVKGFFFINSGKVKVVSSIDDGKDRILRLSSSGDLVGHRAIHAENFPISAIALTDAELTFIPLEIFVKMIRNNSDFALFLIDFIATELRVSEYLMKNMIHQEIINRIAIIICFLIDSFGYDPNNKGQLYFTLPRSDIANMAGTTYESVIRSLAKLEEMKLIKLERKNIVILKESALRNLTGRI